MEEEPCVVIDTETSGGQWPVIELAAIGLRSGVALIHARYNIPPGAPWNPHAERVHQIPRSALRGLPTCLDCRDHILQVLAGRIVIGHNLSFDVRALLRTLGVATLGERRRMCTLQLARLHLPGLQGYKLEHVAATLGVSFPGRAHTALVDAEVARQVYLAIRQRVLAARGRT